jgi:rhomboid protease GluP
MQLEALLAAPATLVISIFNVVWFLYVTTHGNTTNAEVLVRFGATERSRIWEEGESWRLLTSCFLHIGWIHLLWNSYMMFGWCSHVEQELGTVRFVMAYLMTGIGASAVSVLAHRSISAGASGAGFGMIGVTLMIAYRHLGSWSQFWTNPWVLSTVRSTVVWILIGIFAVRMDNFAHVGGLIFGLLAGYALSIEPDAASRIPFLLGVIAIWIVVVWMSLHPRFARRDSHDL